MLLVVMTMMTMLMPIIGVLDSEKEEASDANLFQCGQHRPSCHLYCLCHHLLHHWGGYLFNKWPLMNPDVVNIVLPFVSSLSSPFSSLGRSPRLRVVFDDFQRGQHGPSSHMHCFRLKMFCDEIRFGQLQQCIVFVKSRAPVVLSKTQAL